MKRLLITLFAFTLLTAQPWAAEPEFALHDGDRVGFLGDSITEQRLYTTYIEAYTLTRFPKQKFTFFNSGWGGDTAWLRMRSFPDEKALHAAQGEEKEKMIADSVDGPLQRDVISFKPTVVFVNFGMNDHNYEAFREDIFKTYVRSQTHLVQMLAKNRVRIILLTPQPIENRTGDPSTDPRNIAIRKFADGLRDVAAKEKASFIDQFDPYMAIVKREHALDAAASVGGGDEVHPGPAGHTLMAAAILKKLNAPSLVSSAEIDMSGKVTSATKCAITNIKAENGTLSFDRLDECLPMPIDDKASSALKLAPVLEELNRYAIKVSGLTQERYELVIDGESVATASREELASGWNLATSAGPITKQSQEIQALIFQKNHVGKTLWEAQIHNRKKELATLPGQLEELEAKLNNARQPKSHHFEIKPSGTRE